MRPAFAPWLATTNAITAGFLSAGGGTINMAGGLPAPETYPAAELADIAARVIRDDPGGTLGYSPVDGLPALRDAIAERFCEPGLTLTRDNVLVTTAGMQALDLVAKVLLVPGSEVAVQFPTYLGALDAWRIHAPRYRPYRPDDNDLDPDALLAEAQFGYAVPNFSNPTGRLVGLGVRQRIVQAAHRTGTWLVEDDPYGTLQYDGAPLPRMIALSGGLSDGLSGGAYDGPVVYMGTLSKEIVPGLRIGWVIAAPAMIRAMTAAKQGSDMCTSGVTQGIALEALRAGLIERIRPGVIDLYRARRDALCAAMADYLAPWFDWERPVGGMFVWAVARDPGFDTDRLLTHAVQAGVFVSPSSVFDPEGGYRRAVRLNFTLNDADRLAEGVRRLALACRAMDG
jgi:2-aminoadipate transaminase